MPYTIKRYSSVNGGSSKPNKTVNDIQIDNTYSSIGLIGSYNESYKSQFFQNMLWKMENFSHTIAPLNPIEGQLWFNPDEKSVKVYISNDKPTSVSSDWKNLGSTILNELTDHESRTGINDPHETTKEQVGLGNVPNVYTFNKTLNLADVLDASICRSNLEVYGTSETYNKTTVNNLFMAKGGTVNNTDRLDGLTSADFVLVDNPVVYRTFDTTSIITNTALTYNNSKGSIVVNTGAGNIDLLSGIRSDGRIASANDTGAMLSFINDNSDPMVTMVVFNRATANNQTAQPVRSYRFTKTNLIIDYDTNPSEMYHTGRIPSNAAVGSLPLNGKAVNTLLLNGMYQSSSPNDNAVALRDGAGDVHVRHIQVSNPDENIETGNLILFRNSNTSDNYVRRANVSSFQSWFRANEPKGVVKAWIQFNGITGSTYKSHNCTLTKLGTGKYRIYYNSFSTPAAGSVVPFVGVTSDGQISTGMAAGTGRLSYNSSLVYLRSTTYTDLEFFRTYNINYNNYSLDSFTNVYADANNITFTWFF